ncbi:toxin ParE [Candidatus Termititenax dinenymphae]|uniref:Toxin ParE n=1 Tax=Candidatus Termititenax dinenymphae TaxID=2218523 RepID=A0A388TL92_9BACT|nr:toxin ParE [Candidatus Termititenax dinenymphae]
MLGNGLYEIRIHYGAGYRLYFVKKSDCWLLILCGGDKSTQNKDVKLAKKIAKEL